MKQTFDTPLKAIDSQDRFSQREIGLKHPDMPNLFVRLRDNGDLEIVAGEGLAILMSPSKSCITFVADHVNFLTKSDEGLRWNHVSFNSRAVSYHEPTFISKSDDTLGAYDTYEGIDMFIDPETDMPSGPFVTDGQGNRITLQEYAELKREGKEAEVVDYPDLPEEFFPC